MDPHIPADTGHAPPNAPPAGRITLDMNDMANAMRHRSVATTSETNSAISSAPPTPGLQSAARRTSQPATSPIPNSPRQPHEPLRRASSSASLNRPLSSPRLTRKGSRTSMGGTPEEQERRPTPKRSISNLITGLREAQSTMEAIEEPIPLTAAQIATEHFTRELVGHARPEAEAETVVILHDACYGHRWSRLKTSKSSLSMIVERPERIHASVLGASTAYVRLGGHHEGAKHAPHPERNQVSNPPFKIRRSGRAMDITSPCVTNVHGTAWMSELKTMCHGAGEKLAAGVKELSRVSAPGEPEKQRLHEGDLYLAPESLSAFQGALGGVADAVDTVFAEGSATKRAFVAVRPPGHHCSADHPSGFCWLNNVHVGIEYAAQTYGLTHAAILDFDLHHGDGSQAITWERNGKNYVERLSGKPKAKLKLNPDIGYYSLHDINSYPCELGDDEKVQAASLCIENAHSQSIWNVHLQSWKTEDDFWLLYEGRYRILLDKAKIFFAHHASRLRSEGKVHPKTAIFISAGFDASEWEGAGMQRHKVSVPTEFYARFTQDIVKLAQSVEGCEGRVISVLEGGYSDRALCSGVLSHLSGLCASPVNAQTNGVDALMDLSNQMNGLGITETLRYDKDWWSAANLTALENKVKPPPPPQAKKVRAGPQPTYATPTESFAYKVIDPQKFARSISGTMREMSMPARPPTPPPPEVDWVIATQELSRLLIPIDRQTKSCTPEDLAVVRSKKEQQSAAPAISTQAAGQPRQLRDRKAKGPTVYAESAHSDESTSVRSVSRAESRSSRRETIDVLPTENSAPAQEKRASRRLSAGSALTFSSASVDANAPPVPTVPTVRTTIASNKGAMRPPPLPATGTQINNKKIRASSKPRKTTAATSAPASPARGANKPATSAASTISNTGGNIAPPPPPPPPSSSGVDGLTAGMKKVTLKVAPTKEEHDRKQKEKLDAERRARALKAAETRRVNAAAKKAAQANAVPSLAAPSPAVNTMPPPPAIAPARPQAIATPVPAPTTTTNIADAMDVEQPKVTTGKENMQPRSLSVNEWAKQPVPTIETTANDLDTQSKATPSEPVPIPPRTGTPIEVPAHLGKPAEELELAENANSVGSASVSPAPKPQVSTNVAGGSSPNPETVSGLNSTAPSSPGTQSNGNAFEPSFGAPWVQAAQSSNAAPPPNNENDIANDDSTNPKRVAPSPMRPASSKGNLPVWSSTGPIPFAPSNSRPASSDEKEQRTIWDVPDTPAK